MIFQHPIIVFQNPKTQCNSNYKFPPVESIHQQDKPKNKYFKSYIYKHKAACPVDVFSN